MPIKSTYVRKTTGTIADKMPQKKRLIFLAFVIIALLIIAYVALNPMPKKVESSITLQQFESLKTIVENRTKVKQPMSNLYGEGFVYEDGEFQLVFFPKNPTGNREPFFDTITVDELAGSKHHFTLANENGKIMSTSADKDVSGQKTAEIVDRIRALEWDRINPTVEGK